MSSNEQEKKNAIKTLLDAMMSLCSVSSSSGGVSWFKRN